MSNKKRRTLRIPTELAEKIEQKANELGISTNAYITMVLAKELMKGAKNID